MVKGLSILLIMQFVGEVVSRGLEIPIPGNVLGMGLLLAALGLGVVRLEWVQEAADLLLSHLALLFVPAGVGVMVYLDLIARQWLPIVAATVISTFVVMAVTAWTESLVARKGRRHVE
ncbi:CidA/LrgA family protein [Desulfuromonas sp. AOP6]|uniref:CidA/LrgA family protein n=1 Tax=Desulfuromonas sp. AOP6 TaxID=1566351 RepID=UPI0012742B0E|nr:CidA/LrgA family protein [Desulfuromonas sp. AOP6]BCA80043.1 CidA/CDS family protein [Desulfuromonas sp. AOP6]